MNSFKEKIMQKRRDEQAMLRASFQNFETAILSDHSSENINNEFVATQKAVETVLKYYGKKVKKIPKYIDGIDARLEYAMRPYGIMRRSIALTEKWYKDSFGPIIAFTKKENRPVALIPNNWGGYTYHDYVSGAEVHLNKFTATFFKKEGLCFYRPLPQKNVGKLSLLMYMRKCIPASDYIKATLSILVVTLLGLLLPRITYVISGKVVEDRDTTLLYVISALLLSVLATSQMINIVKEQIVNRIKIKAVVQVEAALMARLVLLPVNFFRQYSAGDLYSRTCYATFLCESVIENTFSVGISFLMSLLFLGQIRRYTPELYPMSLIIVLVVIGLSVVAAIKQNEISHKRMKRESEEMGINYSMIAGVQKIKTTGAEKRAFSKWADTYSETAKETYNPPFFLKIFPVLPIVVLLFGTVFIYFFAYASDVIYASDYIAFSTAFAMLMVAVNAVSSSALSVAEAMPILEMVKPILAEIPETSEDKELIVGVKGNIDINQLSFSYPLSSTRVIEDLSLHIKEGEYVAIVGKSGSGKSTLLRLLLGFEKPEKGNILYDGKDLNKIDLKSLRRSIGTVLQNDSIVFGDIYTNITFHSPWLTVDDAWKAAEIAGIAEDIRQMPMGMRTIIDEGQGGLSGGQKQRILIARAIVLHPRILFFDEATSALDNITQKQVADALDTLDCTRVIIAHRLSTVQNCDRILVLDHGKIIEQGSYEELMKMDGTFAELVRRQRIDAEV